MRMKKMKRRVRRSLELFFGSCCVYAIVAACATAEFDGKHAWGEGGDRALEDDAQNATNTGGDRTEPGKQAMNTGGDTTQPGNGGASTTGGGGGILDPVRAAQAYESGTRLKARRHVSADGASAFAGWYDSARKENCSLQSAVDGTTRCLPTGSYVFIKSYFADSSCTQPVAAGSACPSAQPYFLVGSLSTASGCSPIGYQYSVHVRGAAVTASHIYVKSGDNCVQMANSYQACSDNCYYYVGAEVPLSSFVVLNEQVDD